MFSGIVSLLTVALGILFWWVKRRSAQAADPREQNRLRYEQIDKDIRDGLSRGDSKTASLAASAHSSADLDELERVQRSGGAEQRPD